MRQTMITQDGNEQLSWRMTKTCTGQFPPRGSFKVVCLSSTWNSTNTQWPNCMTLRQPPLKKTVISFYCIQYVTYLEFWKHQTFCMTHCHPRNLQLGMCLVVHGTQPRHCGQLHLRQPSLNKMFKANLTWSFEHVKHTKRLIIIVTTSCRARV